MEVPDHCEDLGVKGQICLISVLRLAPRISLSFLIEVFIFSIVIAYDVKITAKVSYLRVICTGQIYM